jgi:hypothetical protein
MANEKTTVTIEDAQLIFKNFAGVEGQFNVAGDREFSVIIDHENAKKMEADGWNIKYLKPREDGDEPTPYLPVKVSYKVRPPTVVMMTSTARTRLDESSIETLDWADIQKADLIVTPYHWAVGAKTGVKAYLKSLYVIVQEDDLERKYAIHEPEDIR